MEKTYNAWVLVEPSEDLTDQWVAHCLDFDVVTQSHDVESAFAMAAEAVASVLVDDLLAGRNPLERRAPEECWKAFYDVMSHGAPATAETLKNPPRTCRFAGPIEFRVKQAVTATASSRP